MENIMNNRNHLRVFLSKFSFSACLCSAIIVVLYDIGLISYDRVVGYSVNFIGKSGLLGVVIVSIPVMIGLAYLISRLFQRMDQTPLEKSAGSPSFRRYFLGLLLFWLPVFLLRFPGNFDPDTFDQIRMGYRIVSASDHHPWLDTLLFTSVWRLGDIVHNHSVVLLLYTTIQMTLTALLFSFTLCWMNRHQIPSAVCSLSFWFLAVFPFVPLLAQAMAKDMVHGLFFVIFYLIFIDILKSHGSILSSRSSCICFVLSSILMILTKKTGIYLFIPTLILAVLYVNKKRLFLSALSLIVVLIWFCWQSVLLPFWQIEKGEQREMIPIPSQQVSYLVRVRSDELTEEDWHILEGVYTSPQTITDRYFPLRADAAKMRWKEDASGESLVSFAQWYLKAWIRWPFSMIESWAANHYPLLCLDTKYTAEDETYLFFRNNIPQRGTYDDTFFEDIFRSDWQSDLITSIDSLYLHLSSCFPLLFTKPLYAIWLPLTALLYACHRRSFQLVIMLFPLLLNTATLTITSIVVPRYMLISIYCMPILLSLPFMIPKQSKE